MAGATFRTCTHGHTGSAAGKHAGREDRDGGWRRQQGEEYVRGEKDVAVVGAVCARRNGGRHCRCVPHAMVAVERTRRDNVERSATCAVDGSVVSVTPAATAAVERVVPGGPSGSASGSASVASVVACDAAVARVCEVDAGDARRGTTGIRAMSGNIFGAGAGRGSCVVPRRRAVHSWRSTIVDCRRPWRQRPLVRRRRGDGADGQHRFLRGGQRQSLAAKNITRLRSRSHRAAMSAQGTPTVIYRCTCQTPCASAASRRCCCCCCCGGCNRTRGRSGSFNTE